MLDFAKLQSEAEDDVAEVSLAELQNTDWSQFPEDLILNIFESDFPECSLWRDGDEIVAEITEHIYTKYWWHKYHASVFADAMINAVLRLASEGWPLAEPEIESDDDVHLWVRWQLHIPLYVDSNTTIESVRASFDRVWERANAMLEHSDSVLILGKDTADGLEKLKRIEALLERLGYYTYIVKEEPDRLGESVIQKVLRFALSSKFILVENSEQSGHLYELPHVTKMAECVTACLQQRGTGATWIFEDAYAKHRHFRKFEYDDLERAVAKAAEWAEGFIREFGRVQRDVLPWMKKTSRDVCGRPSS